MSFRALHLPGHNDPLGYVPLEIASLLLGHGVIGEAENRLVADAGADLSARLEDIRDLLAREGVIGPPRGEHMAVRTAFDGPVLGTIDRSALRILGLWATKIHVNGIVQAPEGPFIWLSRRAATSAAEPGTFDTLVAGGQSVRETELDTVHKEGREEAGLTPLHFSGLRASGRIPVHYVSSLGFHRELLVTYDLDLDEGFEPWCGDGEIDHHVRVGIDVLTGNGAGFPLKRSSHIVCVDFLRRYGIWRAEPGAVP